MWLIYTFSAAELLKIGKSDLTIRFWENANLRFYRSYNLVNASNACYILADKNFTDEISATYCGNKSGKFFQRGMHIIDDERIQLNTKLILYHTHLGFKRPASS